MKLKSKNLQRCFERRDLVSIHRENIDSSRLQGFVLCYSKSLVCLHQITDFASDGIIVIRRKDISKLKIYASDRIDLTMLRADGIAEQLDFTYQPPLKSFHDFLKSLADSDIIIVQKEIGKNTVFFIGRTLSIETDRFAGLYFDREAEWDDDPWEIKFNKITCCQIRTRYTDAYTRHFDRIESIGTSQ